MARYSPREDVVKCAVVYTLGLLLAAPATAQTYRYEAENGVLSGVQISTSAPGYSGTGYVTGFDSASDHLTITVNNLPDGLYELWVRYRSPFGHKGYGVQADSEIGDATFDTASSFSLDRAGLFNLTGATNTLQIQQGWGYYDIDYLELRPATVRPVTPISSHLSDPLANFNTQALMNYLAANYGVKTLAGQQGLVGQNDPFPSAAYLSKSGGLVPAVRGSDFLYYSPSFLEHQDARNGETERIINWAKQTGGIPEFSWHWNAPTDITGTWYQAFYTQNTSFDVQAALADPSGPKYQLLLRDIDAIGVELKKLQDAGVPVLWRPLHEAQGNSPPTGNAAWFWWGAKGPQAFKDLWRLMYNRLTNVDGLHNLIWVYTSSDAVETHLDWYPGDDVVDIVGADVYTNASSSMSGQWLNMLDTYDGRKMITLSETGTLPNADLLRQRGIDWSWFSPWSVSDTVNNYSSAQLQALLGDNDIITLNELPTTPWSTSAPIPGDYNHNGVVDMADYVVWRKSAGQTGWGLAADSDLNGRIDAADFDFWRAHFGQSAGNAAFAGAAVPEPATLMMSALGIVLLVSSPRGFPTCRGHKGRSSGK
jgi:mannan endo-1,4-beta-mannosidase